MEYTAETVEVKEICEDQNPAKKLKKIVKGCDQKLVTDWKNDPNYKNWVEKTKKDEETTTYHFVPVVQAECIEIDADGQKRQAIEVKSVRKPITPNISTVKNTRANKRQIKVLDPNLPAFVCTEHNENINYDCRYCRIACGFKKKNAQKFVQNDEISSTGKVTVAIPKRENSAVHAKTLSDGTYLEGSPEALNGSFTRDASASVNVSLLQKNSKFLHKFRPEWLKLPEFKEWLIETKLSEDITCAQCKYCGNLLVNNANNLVRHAISKKHMKNEIENSEYLREQVKPASNIKLHEIKDGKEDIFGRYIASELKRIKNKKTYEEVKWKILQALQSAAEKETEEVETIT